MMTNICGHCLAGKEKKCDATKEMSCKQNKYIFFKHVKSKKMTEEDIKSPGNYIRSTRCVCGYVHYPDKESFKDVDMNTEEWNQPFETFYLKTNEYGFDFKESQLTAYACPKCKALRIE